MNVDITIKSMYFHRRLLKITNKYFSNEKNCFFYDDVIAPRDENFIVHVMKGKVWIHVEGEKVDDNTIDNIKGYINSAFNRNKIIIQCDKDWIKF